MSSEPQPLPPDPEEAPLSLDDAPPGGSFFDKVGPHAPMILLASSVVGLISIFLPLQSISVPGLSANSPNVFLPWQGKLCLVGYLALGALGGLVLGKVIVLQKPYGLGALITAGVVLLLALWILFAVSRSGGGIPGLVEVSTGVGCYINLLAALAVTGAAVIVAKTAKVF
jgi:hypothetical protein